MSNIIAVPESGLFEINHDTARQGGGNSATASIRLDGAGGNSFITGSNFGIGTNNPSYPLHVRKPLGSDLMLLDTVTHGGLLFDSEVGDGRIKAKIATTSSSLDLVFHSSSQRIYFEDGNKVGIGTVDPSAVLHVEDTSLGYNQAVFKAVGGGSALVQIDGQGTIWSPKLNLKTTNQGIARKGSGRSRLWASYSIDIEDNTNDNNVLARFDTTNFKVGIGTDSPESILHVVADTGNAAASLGSEIVASQTAAGTNWAGSSIAVGYAHTAGSTDPLVTTLTVTANKIYRFEIETTNVTAGRLDKVSVGGQDFLVYISNNSSRILSVRTSSTAALTFESQSAFVGTVKVNSFKEVAVSDSSTVLVAHDNSRVETRVFGNNDFFIGRDAGENRISSSNNIGIGDQALRSICTQGINLVVGNSSLTKLTNGSYNVALGHNILPNYQKYGNLYNIGIGNSLMTSNSLSGQQNIMIGFWGGGYMTTASHNLGIGYNIFADLVNGSNNIALGEHTLSNVTAGDNNTSIGNSSLLNLTTTSNNVAVGFYAGRYIVGNSTNVTPSTSVFLGYNTKAGADGQSNQIVIGASAEGIGSNTVTLGNDNIVYTALKGNVGIGTTNPNVPLEIKGTVGGGNLFGINTTTHGHFRISPALANSRNAIKILTDNSALDIKFAPSSKRTYFGGNGDDQKVGINTASPNSTLEVVGHTIAINTTGIVGKGLHIGESYDSIGIWGSTDVGSHFNPESITVSAANRNTSNSAYIDLYSRYGSTASSFGDIDLRAGSYPAGNMEGDITLYTSGQNRLIAKHDGKVGIGTPAPEQKLHVSGDSFFNGEITLKRPDTPPSYATGKIFVNPAGQLQINHGSREALRATSNTATTIWGGSTNTTFIKADNADLELKVQLGGQLKINAFYGDDDLAFYSHGGNKILSVDTDASANSFVVASDSNVGIGVADPAKKLEVNGDILIPQNSTLQGNYGNALPHPLIGLSSSIDTIIYASGNNSSDIFFKTNVGGTLDTRVTITNAGRVGIGTTNPSDKLEVHGKLTIKTDENEMLALNATDGADVFMSFERNSDRHAYVGFVGTSDTFNIVNEESAGVISYSALGYQTFNTAGVEAMRIASDGDISVGTNVAQARLDVRGTGRFVSNAPYKANEIISSPNISGHASNTSAIIQRDILNPYGVFGAKQVFSQLTNNRFFGRGRQFIITSGVDINNQVTVGTAQSEKFTDGNNEQTAVGVVANRGDIVFNINVTGNNAQHAQGYSPANGYTYVDGVLVLDFYHVNTGQITDVKWKDKDGNIRTNADYRVQGPYKTKGYGGLHQVFCNIAGNYLTEIQFTLKNNPNNTASFTQVSYVGRRMTYPEGPFVTTNGGNIYHEICGYEYGTVAGDGGAKTLKIDPNGDSYFDTDTLYVDASTDRVGIGTDSPTHQLTVAGTGIFMSPAADANNAIRIGHSSSIGAGGSSQMGLWAIGQGKMWLKGYSDMHFGYNKHVTIKDGGNVGIGTDSPATLLHVKANNNVGPTIELQNAQYSSYINAWGSSAQAGRTSRFEINAAATDFAVGAKTIRFQTHNQGGAGTLGDASEKMRIDSAGNVGINTTSPQTKLHVSNGDLRVDNEIYVKDITANHFGSSQDLNLRGGSSAAVRFFQHTTQRMCINANGNVGIGTAGPASRLTIRGEEQHTTSTISNTDALLDIYNDWESNTDEKGAIITFSDNYYAAPNYHKTTRAAIKGGTDTVGNTADGFLAFYTDSTSADSASERMRIDHDGNVGIGTTSPSEKLHVFGNTLITGAGSNSPSLILAGTICDWKIENQYVNGANNDMFRIRNGELGSDAIVINRGNNRVGIGGTNPQSPLEVINDATSYDGITLKDAGGGLTARIGAGDAANNARVSLFNGSHQVAIQLHANTSNPTFFNAGKVGIGTVSPQGNLQVNTANHNTFALAIGNDSYTGGSPRHELLMLNNGSLQWYLPDNGSTPAKFQFYSRDNSEFFFTADSDTSRIGIGTNSPDYTLDVNGRVRIKHDLYLDGAFVIKNISNHLYLDAASSKDIIFRPNNGTQAAVITSAGRVGIGSNSPQTKLDVDGTIKNTVYVIGSLPSASPAGQRAFVSNASSSFGSSTVGQTVSAGASNFAPVYSDGSYWRYG